jgi:hypothetical protein
MFGHNSNDQSNTIQHGSDSAAGSSIPSLEPETIAPTAAPSQSSAPVVDDTAIGSYVATDLPNTAAATATPPVSHPADDITSDAAATTPVPVAADIIPEDSKAASITMASPPPVTPPSHEPTDNSGLLELKQSALHELSPLLGHLDQTPEEKFRTTMMMIQASDDQTMLQTAYEAAKAIGDEKVRAQALLDVVNEINYFTQAQNGDHPSAE